MKLTADLLARAIIAAARSYGDDPVRACESVGNSRYRRCLTAAASGISQALGLRPSRVASILGISPNAVIVARSPSKRRSAFDAAEKAAAAAAARFKVAEPAPVLRIPVEFDEPEIEAVEAGGCAPPIYVERRPPPVPKPTPPAPERQISIALRPPRPIPEAAPAPAPVAQVSTKPRLVTREADAPGSLRARILGVLQDAPSTQTSLAILTDAKELAVIEALKQLVAEGIVEGGPINPSFGARYREWRMKGAAA